MSRDYLTEKMTFGQIPEASTGGSTMASVRLFLAEEAVGEGRSHSPSGHCVVLAFAVDKLGSYRRLEQWNDINRDE